MTNYSPGFRIGDYELVRLLGRGGMGEVWMASDLKADRGVALKFIKPHYLDDPQSRTRFLNEARTLGRLEHDRIVSLYNVVEADDQLALVLRFIDGVALSARIDSEGPLPLDFVLSSARDILPALGFAHEQGVIHRDIKSQNILLDRQNRSFLTDFGIALGDFIERGTVTGFSTGTPHYMSPEQIKTPRLLTPQTGGARTDIYSYGVVLYEMLTGRVPFCAESGAEDVYSVQNAHCVSPVPPLRDVNPAVPAKVEAAVLRCLAKDPDDRPQTCKEVLEELEASVQGAAHHAPTRVERRAAPQTAAPVVVRPPVAQPSRGVPKVAWLGLGAILIVGGISYAIMSGGGKVVTPPTGPSGATGSSEPTGTGGITGSTGPSLPPGPGPSGPASPAPKKNVPDPNAVEAEKSYLRAVDFSQRQMFCEGVPAIDDAVRRVPGEPKYLALQGPLNQKCKDRQAAEVKSKEAEDQFTAGNYCEGKGAIDKAIELDPSTPKNPKYIALQQRLARGCGIHLP